MVHFMVHSPMWHHNLSFGRRIQIPDSRIQIPDSRIRFQQIVLPQLENPCIESTLLPRARMHTKGLCDQSWCLSSGVYKSTLFLEPIFYLSKYSLSEVYFNTHRLLIKFNGLWYSLAFGAHYQHIISRAYRVLGLLRRTFSSNTNLREKKRLYVSLVRSQLVYCSPFWRPYLLKDISQLETVQRRATKFILNDFRSDYKSRL